jgi:hypothetical protein
MKMAALARLEVDAPDIARLLHRFAPDKPLSNFPPIPGWHPLRNGAALWLSNQY